ncbi:hypothetical protein Mapa_006421 [Marchantia paleacea]|nr:hypothetical protein Mapa_006421 [Marchantia paleacea]
MGAARKLATRSRSRFYGGGYRGARGNWQIALVVGFGVLGTGVLASILKKMSIAKIEHKRSLLKWTVFFVMATLGLCVPAIVILCGSPSNAVGILAIVSLCFLLLPLVVWIPMAVRRARRLNEKSFGVIEPEPHDAYAAQDKSKIDETPYPAYNFLPQASTASTAAVGVDGKPHFPEHTKPYA